MVPLEELQSCLVMKRIRDRLRLLFDLPLHTTLQYITINYEVTVKKCFHTPPSPPHFQNSSVWSLKSKQKSKASGERKKEQEKLSGN